MAEKNTDANINQVAPLGVSPGGENMNDTQVLNDWANFQEGQLKVRLNQGYFAPGETVEGVIYIRPSKEFRLDAVKLNLQKEQNISFVSGG